MTRPRVVVSRALPEGWLAALNAEADLVIGDAARPGLSPELLAALADAEGLLCLLTETVDAELLRRAPRLKVVSNMAVGVDNIDVDACTRRGIPVGHTPGVLTEATADLAFALLLAAARKLCVAADDARAGRWSTWSPTGWLGADLHGATLGIVGLGQIGRAVCRRAAGFGMRVVVTARRHHDLDALRAEGVRVDAQVELDALLAMSDFVSLHVPLTDATERLIDAAALARMKSTAILVNTSRGPIVDQDALVRALQQRTIGGAALDVTVPEPLPPSHPLFALPNVVVAPHIGSATVGTRRRMAELAAANVLAALRGERLPHCVNPQVYAHPG